MQKKNVVTPSVQSITPSNQPLENAGTTTVPALTPTSTEPAQVAYIDPNLKPPLPSATGTSASIPSTSVSSPAKPLPPPQKVSQNILNAVIYKHVGNLSEDEGTEGQITTFRKNLEKAGYSKEQLDKAFESFKTIPQIEPEQDPNYEALLFKNKMEEIDKQEALKSGTEKTIEKILSAPANIVMNTAENSAMMISEGLSQGIEGKKKSILAQIDAHNHPEATKKNFDKIMAGELNVVAGGAKAAFGVLGFVSPQMAAFNLATEAIHQLPDEAKEQIVLGMSPQAAALQTPQQRVETFNTTVDFPFAAASTIAHMAGRDPKAGTSEAAIYEILNVLVPIGAHKMGSRVRVNEFTDIANGISDGTATPEQVKLYGDVVEGIKNTSLGEVKDALAEKAKADAQKNYMDTPNEEIVNVQKEGETPQTLKQKVDELNAKIDQPAEVTLSTTKDGAGTEYYWAEKNGEKLSITPEEYATQKELQAQELNNLISERDKTLAMAEAVAVHDKVKDNPQEVIGEITANEDLTPEEKQVAIDKVTNSVELDAAQKTVEDAKIQHIKDLHALSEPKSMELYQLAESAIADENVIPRVKKSIEAAIEAKEITPEEGQKQLDNLKSRVETQKIINPGIKGDEYRMEAADLIEKRKVMKDRLAEMKGYIPPMPESTILAKEKAIEAIDNKLSELQIKSKEDVKNEKATNQTEKTDVLTPEQEKTHSVWKRVVGEIKDETLKKGLEDYDLSYIVRKEALTESKAREVLDAAIKSDRLSDVEKIIVDRDNEMDIVSRGTLSAMLGKHYFDLAEKTADPVAKEKYMDEFYNYTDKAASIATLGGQVGNQVGKTIKKMYMNNPETVVSQVKRKMDVANKKVLEGHKEDIKNTYEAIREILETPEGQAVVTEEIVKRSERLFGKETQEKITNFFDAAKLKPGSTYSSVIPPPLINGAIEIMKQSALLGAKGAKIITAGVEHINAKMNGEKWDEKSFREEWEEKLKQSGIKFGKELTTEQRLKIKEKSLTKLLEFIDNPQDYIDKLEEKRKKSAEAEIKKPEEIKAIEAEIKEARSTLDKLKGAIEAPGDKMKKIAELDEFIKNPDKYIEQLEEKRAERLKKEGAKSEEVKSLEAEIKEKKKILEEIVNPPKIKISVREQQSILDAIEKKAGRLNETNRAKFLKEVIHVVESEGGLSEQRFKDLYAEALGLETMTPELSTKITDLSKKINEADKAKKAVSEIYDDLIQEKADTGKISAASKDKLKQANKELNSISREADKAESELSSTLRDKKDFADTFISLMQLNVLTPISLARNIVGTLPDVMLIRPASNFLAGGLDFLRSQAAQNKTLAKHFESERSTSPLARTKGAWLALPDAYRNMITSIMTSETPGRAGTRNMFNKMEPVKAAGKIWDALQGKSKMNVSEWASSILESTAGFPAAAVGRGLIGPDTFFRTVSEQAKLYELASVKGLKGIEAEKFVKNPDAESLTAAEDYADVVTYQGDNKVSKALSSMKRSFKADQGEGALLNSGKSVARVLAASQALFVKTPTNVLIASVKLAFPEVSMATGLVEWKKGNKEQAMRDFALAITGATIRVAASDMADKGIINPATDYDDKKRMLEDNEGKRGGQLNYSRMMRYLTGQDDGEKKTDVWIDYKFLGPVGLIFGAQSALSQEKKQTGEDMGYFENTGKGAAYSLGYVAELPYIQSMGMIADAIKDPERNFNSWAAGTVGTLASALYPNTASNASKASVDDAKKMYDKDLSTYIKNKFKYQMFQGEDLPSKITLWGEKMSAAPKGADPYSWYLLNFYKDRNPSENSMSYKLQELHEKIYEETHERAFADKVIPTPPAQTITISNQKVLLDKEEYEDLQVYIGKRRKALVEAYMASDDYEKDSDDTKVDRLADIYRDSSKDGKDMLVSGSDRLTEIQNQEGSNPITGNRSSKRARPSRQARPKRNVR